MGFDAVNVLRMYDYKMHKNQITYLFRKLQHHLFGAPNIVSYRKAMRYFVGKEAAEEYVYPTIIPNWDHTPRTGRKGLVFHGSTPELFERHLKNVFKAISGKKDETNIVFIKSWNEWAEGNYMEPDLRYGTAYLQKLKKYVEE